MRTLGVLDCTLAVDTKLFIDPLRLSKSRHAEMKERAAESFQRHFDIVIALLASSNEREDVAWRNARRQLSFHEIRGTCLGYGAGSITGSAFGPELTERILVVGKQIVDLGVRDPLLFPAMALFEDDIGPDRISDMTTNVIIQSLVEFNERVLKDLGLSRSSQSFEINGASGRLLRNPFASKMTPIILVPRDVLRKLPIACDWDEVADASASNEAIRRRVNEHIGHIWATKTKRDRTELRGQALANRTAFDTLLATIRAAAGGAYDVDNDPDGLLTWARVGPEYAAKYPLPPTGRKPPRTPDDVLALVTLIVAQFRHLVEARGLDRELYREGGKPRHENSAQRLFFAIAYSYCKANDLDLTPEAETGNGPVDFKFSKGFRSRVLVEIKLSSNTKLVAGFRSQLDTYKLAEETTRAIYLVIDVGNMGNKRKALAEIRDEAKQRGERLSLIEYVDGIIQPSASKR